MAYCTILKSVNTPETYTYFVINFHFFFNYLVATKPGYHITTLVVEQPIHLRELQFQLGSLADLALPPELCTFVSL